MAVVCDEGVYKIARQIKFVKENEMKSIVLLLGGFHMTKIVLGCIGKYLEPSGIRSLFVEIKLLGVNSVEQVIKGSHYNRSIRAYFLLAEALTYSQFEAFFTQEIREKYSEKLTYLHIIQESIHAKNYDEFKNDIHAFSILCIELKNDFEQFIQTNSEKCSLFKYWNNVLIMIDFVRDLLRADRQGDWDLHINTVQKIQPLFHSMDRINYGRCCPIYLEDMLRLETEMPCIYQKFKSGLFSVKHSKTPFTSVAADQALEQTINRSSKGTSGIIGSTKKKNYVAAWDMIFHKILGISQLYKKITFVDKTNDEFQIHHEMSDSTTEARQEEVEKIIKYIKTKQNPFLPNNEPLINIMTRETIDEVVAMKLLNVFEIGCDKYNEFREVRLDKKTVPLSDLIVLNKILINKKKNSGNESKKIKNKEKCEFEANRVINLAAARGFDLKKLLCYELTPENCLFTINGEMKKEKNKSLLITEIENFVKEEIMETDNGHQMIEKSYEVSSAEPLCVLVDSMIVLRKLKWKNCIVFGDLAEAFCSSVTHSISEWNVVRIDYVFDQYFEKSIKASERRRRIVSNAVDVNSIEDNVTMPVQEESFWSSSSNKEKLQQYIYDFINKNYNIYWPDTEIILSIVKNKPSIAINSSRNNHSTLISLQRSDIEEADVRLMIHAAHAAQQSNNRIIIMSPDTDVFVLCLNYWYTFAVMGLKELWIKLGTNSSTTRTAPIHVIAPICGIRMCLSIIAAHHLTGSDYTSKVGTKKSAIAAVPHIYLSEFGRENDEDIEKSIISAEMYLVQVLQKESQLTKLDDLRYYKYRYGALGNISQLPPTSASIDLHIRRALYVTSYQLNLFNNNFEPRDPAKLGYIVDENNLIPQKVTELIPSRTELVPVCSCTSCSRKTCACEVAKIKCCDFCPCQKNNKSICKNNYK